MRNYLLAAAAIACCITSSPVLAGNLKNPDYVVVSKCYQDPSVGLVCEPAPVANINGVGSVTRPGNTTAYTGNQVVVNNTTGNAVPVQIPVTDSPGGTGFITKASALSGNTAGTAPGTQVWYLFSATPTTTGLVDGSAYVGPYAADETNYLGSLTCSSWAKTNDATAQWRSPCYSSNLLTSLLPFKTVAGQTYVYALLVTTGAYTPISGEVETLVVSSAQNN